MDCDIVLYLNILLTLQMTQFWMSEMKFPDIQYVDLILKSDLCSYF